MAGNGDVLDPPDFSNRRNLAYFTAKHIALLSHSLLAHAHVEMDEGIVRTRRQPGAVFFYAGLHKSLWETSGALVPLYHAGLPVPYVGMGDNLVNGRFFQNLAKRVGTFLIRRPTSRRETLESARRLRSDILGLVARGVDLAVFPEGTRKSVAKRGTYGDFFPTAFAPLLEYEQNRDRLLAANPGLVARDLYIVPFNVDYTRVREAHEVLGESAARPQTLHVFDSFSMIRHIGDTYLSYGRPLRVAERLDLDRKGLAAECRRLCLDLVKILPVNVACLAALRLDPAAFSRAALEQSVGQSVEALRSYAGRFRGFSADDPPAEILRRAERHSFSFERLAPEDRPLHQLYAGYVRHYLAPGDDPLPPQSKGGAAT
jgi:hypothetical protein